VRTDLFVFRLLLPLPECDHLTPDCPKRGSAMVLREAKRGANPGQKFWGCPSFPKCRGTCGIVWAHAAPRCVIGSQLSVNGADHWPAPEAPVVRSRKSFAHATKARAAVWWFHYRKRL